MAFKENLKSELKYQDIQLKELATKTGISKNTLSNYLSGHNSTPSAEAAVKIAQALGVSVEYLVTGHNAEIKKLNLSLKIKSLIESFESLDEIDQEIIQTTLTTMKKRYRRNNNQ